MVRKRKHHSSKKRHHRRGMSGLPKDMLTEVAAGAAGAIGATMIGNVNLPFISDPKLKQGVPLVAGILLVSFSKGNQLLKTAGTVMAGVGAANLLKSYVPGLGEICGEGYLQGPLEQMYGEPAPAKNNYLQGSGGTDDESSYNRA